MSDSERFLKVASEEKIRKLISKLKEANDSEYQEFIKYLLLIIG